MNDKVLPAPGGEAGFSDDRLFEHLLIQSRSPTILTGFALLCAALLSAGTVSPLRLGAIAVFVLVIYAIRRVMVVSPYRGQVLDSLARQRLELSYAGLTFMVGCALAFWGAFAIQASPALSVKVAYAACMLSLAAACLFCASPLSFFAFSLPLMTLSLATQLVFEPVSGLGLALTLLAVYCLSVQLMLHQRSLVRAMLVERERHSRIAAEHLALMSSDSIAFAVTEGAQLHGANRRFRSLFSLGDLKPGSSSPLTQIFEAMGSASKRVGPVMARAAARAQRNGSVKISVALHSDRGESRWLRLEGRLTESAGRLPRMLWMVTDQSAAKKAENELKFLVQHDALTGLANRSQWISRARKSLKALLSGWLDQGGPPRRHGTRQAAGALTVMRNIGMISIDLDSFGAINERFGQPVGDKVLIVVAKRLSNAVRSQDLVARIGSDEFVVLLESIRDRAELLAVLAKLNDLISSPIEVNDVKLQLSASMGMALGPEDGLEVDALLAKANAQRYASKEALRKHFPQPKLRATVR